MQEYVEITKVDDRFFILVHAHGVEMYVGVYDTYGDAMLATYEWCKSLDMQYKY